MAFVITETHKHTQYRLEGVEVTHFLVQRGWISSLTTLWSLQMDFAAKVLYGKLKILAIDKVCAIIASKQWWCYNNIDISCLRGLVVALYQAMIIEIIGTYQTKVVGLEDARAGCVCVHWCSESELCRCLTEREDCARMSKQWWQIFQLLR